ncbi:MAG TPA: hypothetical protein PKV86_03920 [Syntrophobacteraceae bacterium]|nr:hypothetical protein [Syntrophobacteraceae bacterium]
MEDRRLRDLQAKVKELNLAVEHAIAEQIGNSEETGEIFEKIRESLENRAHRIQYFLHLENWKPKPPEAPRLPLRTARRLPCGFMGGLDELQRLREEVAGATRW